MDLNADLAARLVHHAARFASGEDIILLGGSTVAGLGQGSSDYDIYVVSLGAGPGWSEVPQLIPGAGLDMPVEVEFFSAAAIQDQALRLRAAASGGERALREQINQELLVRYSGLLTAVPLRDATGSWPEVIADCGRSCYREIVTSWHRSWCDELCRIAHFLTYIRDYEAAEVAQRAAAAHAFDALLAASGELYFSPKYRFEKAARHHATAGLIDELWAIAAPPRRLSAAALRYRAEIAQRVIAAAGGRGIRDEVIWVPKRAGKVSLRAVGGEVLLVSGTRCWVIDERTAAIWKALAETVTWRELRQQNADLPASGLRKRLRYLSVQGLLGLPAKLGRWAMWV
jgi:hypothetical protein